MNRRTITQKLKCKNKCGLYIYKEQKNNEAGLMGERIFNDYLLLLYNYWLKRSKKIDLRSTLHFLKGAKIANNSRYSAEMTSQLSRIKY